MATKSELAEVIEGRLVKADKKPARNTAETKEEKEARLQAQRLANLTGKGRPAGTPNKITRGIKDAVLESIQPGQCHPEGLKGWLRDRALGGIEDRKIYAGIVSRVIPIEVTGKDGEAIKIDLGWLTGRAIAGQDVIDVTPTSQDEDNSRDIKGLGYDVPDLQSDEEESA